MTGVNLTRNVRARARPLAARLCIGALLLTPASLAQESSSADPDGPAGEDSSAPPEAAEAPPRPSASDAPASTPAPATPPAGPGRPRAAADAPSQAPAVEIAVRGRRIQGGADRSSRAVTQVDLQRAKRESADLATVLSRVEGVNVQRVGGLGSEARFSLAGFDEAQVRFFIDGVPLELAGYPFGFQNVPVSFGERVEVFKGVVPVALGTDALGGAFNLVTDRRTTGTRATASYEAGSFDSHRFAAGARYRAATSGFFTKGEAFLDRSDNDYPIAVKVADRSGLIAETTVRRFHDRYRAHGGNLELGWVDQPWARRLLLRVFGAGYRKEIQHNAIMTAPYGEAEEGGVSAGASLRYENGIRADLTVRAVAGYVQSRADFIDVSRCIYNWFGQCVNDQIEPGELGATAADVSVWDRSGFSRAGLDWSPTPEHRLRFATAPTYHDRTGDDRLAERNDPATAHRTMLKWVNGLEYETELFSGKLLNAAFVKHYVQSARSEESFAGVASERFSDHRLWGFGDGLRYDLFGWLFAKASYEYATRLPEPRELFGNGGFVLENLGLLPERSHNVNLALALQELGLAGGKLSGNVTGFFRNADNLIVLFPVGETLRYENVYQARVWGAEGALSWLSPGEYVEVGGSATYQSLRNESDAGALSLFRGERIPNKPYFWANGRIRLQQRGFAAPRDELSVTWYTRYLRDFYRNWEGAGRKGPEDVVPAQLTHTAALAYVTASERGRQLAATGEVHNITDARLFDFLGVQRPGRAVYFKLTLSH